MSDDRNQALSIEIVADRLMISIGIEALMTAVRGGPDWDDETLTIVHPNAFAAEIANALETNEREDGTTDIHLAIDRAALHVVEYGTDTVRIAGEVYDDE